MKKTSGGSVVTIIIMAIVIVIGLTFAVTQDWTNGRNSIVDYVQARFGDAETQYQTGVRLQKQKRADSLQRAQGWYQSAAERGHVRAMVALGDLYDAEESERSGDQAVLWYEKAAKAGNAEAMRKLAIGYAIGRGKRKADPVKAMQLIEVAAKKGDVEAEYLYGLNLTQNGQIEEGVVWLNKAADHGKPEADYALGKLYSGSWSPLFDMKKAFVYFGRASEAGNWEAQLLYSYMYFNGIETKKDLAEAYKWVLIASDSKQQKAKSARSFVEHYISPAEKAEGEERAAKWRELMLLVKNSRTKTE